MQMKRTMESGRRERVRMFGIVSRRSGMASPRRLRLGALKAPSRKRRLRSALRELEAAAGALAAVLLAFFHAGVSGEGAAVAQLLDHADRPRRFSRLAVSGRLGFGLTTRGAEHRLQRAGQALANRPRLPRDPAPLHQDADIEALVHLGQLQRAGDRGAVL